MKKVLYSTSSKSIYHYKNGIKTKGIHDRITGDISGVSGDVTHIFGDISNISGDVTYISGDVTHVSGNMTGIHGNVTDVYGNLDVAEITDKERKIGINIKDLINID